MAGGMANVMRYAGATETGEKGRSREKSEAHRLWVILRGFSTPGSASLNVEGGSQGWKSAGVGNEREPRGGATEGGAPIHQRPSTLAFPPLSFFSTVRAPSFRVTSALFRPPFLPASSLPLKRSYFTLHVPWAPPESRALLSDSEDIPAGVRYWLLFPNSLPRPLSEVCQSLGTRLLQSVCRSRWARARSGRFNDGPATYTWHTWALLETGIKINTKSRVSGNLTFRCIR